MTITTRKAEDLATALDNRVRELARENEQLRYSLSPQAAIKHEMMLSAVADKERVERELAEMRKQRDDARRPSAAETGDVWCSRCGRF